MGFISHPVCRSVLLLRLCPSAAGCSPPSADLPTRLYLPVLVRKLVGSMEVCSYFSKYGHRVSRKYRNRDVNDGSLLPAKLIVER